MAVAQAFKVDWDLVNREVTQHLQALIRLDTRNPPGNETRVAAYLRDVLAREGIASEIVGPSEDRGSLVARIAGNGAEQPLLLMSHTDVVAVEPEKWSSDPFAAEIVNGAIVGRGAIDMKHMVAMELTTMLLLKRAGVPLKRDVIFMAAADEEVGGHLGAGWIARHRPELIQAEYALNEGGGTGTEVNGQIYYLVQTAEKGTARFRMETKGRPGHGSQPHDQNAVLRLAALITRLQDHRLPVHWTKTVRSYVETIAASQPPEVAAQLHAILQAEDPDRLIDQLPLSDAFKLGLRSTIRNTVSPTMLRAGSQINVIPSDAEAFFDGRILPGWTPEQFRGELQQLFGQDVQCTFIDPSEPLEAEPNSPLFDMIIEVMRERDPQGIPVPTMSSGATDAKHLADLGIKVYGFAPGLHPTDWHGMHGHDEQIRLESLHWGVRTLFEIVARFAGQ
ncbi:MAG: M20/M25/M40 family metallo-hydrolase [Herpetosiphon sp.]